MLDKFLHHENEDEYDNNQIKSTANALRPHINTPEFFRALFREYPEDFLHRKSEHSDAWPYFVEMHLYACFSQRGLQLYGFYILFHLSAI